MKKRTTVIALLLALTMLLSGMLAGCGGKTENNPTPDATKADTTAKADTTTRAAATPDDKVSLKQIGSIGYDDITDYDNAVVYEKDDMYGILSFDGKTDTGAIYVKITEEDGYFVVSTAYPTDENDIDGINADGLADKTGKLVIPAEYAVFDVLNERYVQVYKAKALVGENDDYLIYLRSGMFTSGPLEGDPHYSGEWQIFDLAEGRFVEGASGTNDKFTGAYGNVINFYTDDGAEHYMNEKGEELDPDAEYFDNGCSIIEDDDYNGVFYDQNGKKLFTFTYDDYEPWDVAGDYIVGYKTVNGNSSCVLEDYTGKVVSYEFSTSSPDVADGKIFADGYLCDFDGNKIVEGKFSSWYNDSIRRFAMVLTGDTENALTDMDGNVIVTAPEDGDVEIYTYDFVARKAGDSGNDYYCWKDKDFTIKNAYLVGEGFVQIKEGDAYALIDTVTGEKLLKGYDNYEAFGSAADGLFIYAETEDGGYDIYKLK